MFHLIVIFLGRVGEYSYIISCMQQGVIRYSDFARLAGSMMHDRYLLLYIINVIQQNYKVLFAVSQEHKAVMLADQKQKVLIKTDPTCSI